MPYYSDRAHVIRACIHKRVEPVNNLQYSDYLMHFGIPFMKWGVRRYQKENGSLTEEGKIRYAKKKPESETWKKSDAESLSDEELNRRNSRLQRERTYKDLTTSEVERERKERRKNIVNKVIIGTAISLAAVAMKGHYKKAISFIGNFAKRKIAPFKAAGILKKSIKSKNVPHAGQYNPLRDYALKKHPSWNGLDLVRRIET